MSDELREQLKEIYATFVPIIESEKIRMAFEIGKLCWSCMQFLNQEATEKGIEISIGDEIDDCMELTGLSKNQVVNTSMLYNWTQDNGFIIDSEINMDILYSWWSNKQGGLPTLAKIMRLILPKPIKEDREVKKATLKRKIGKAINEANYIDFKALDDEKMILNITEGI